MPHEQGAWVLLCVSGGAVEGADGGRPTSRGCRLRWFGGGEVGVDGSAGLALAAEVEEG